MQTGTARWGTPELTSWKVSAESFCPGLPVGEGIGDGASTGEGTAEGDDDDAVGWGLMAPSGAAAAGCRLLPPAGLRNTGNQTGGASFLIMSVRRWPQPQVQTAHV